MEEFTTDEELILLMRLGSDTAESKLTCRYLDKRKYIGKRAAPNLIDFIDPYEYNSTYYRAFLQAVSSYRFGEGLFYTYLEKVLSHEMTKYCIKESVPSGRIKSVSMERRVNSRNENDPICLHDVVSSGDPDPINSPELYFDYAETLQELNKLPSYLKKKDMDFLTHIYRGFSFKEACTNCALGEKDGRRAIRLFKRFIEEIKNHSTRKRRRKY